jgi:lipoprotein-anchoring transpeptidase ErfK/SrfK
VSLAAASAVGLAAVLALASCTARPVEHSASSDVAAHRPARATSSATSTSASPSPHPTVLNTSFISGHAISPTTPVTLTVAHGKLTGVKMVNPAGKVVTGALSADGTSWHNTEPLGYAKTYRITATGTDASGTDVTKHTAVTTLAPANQTMPYLDRLGNYPLGKNQTYGVAIVPVVHFDEPITRKAVAQRALSVHTSPHVAGSWNWVDDQDVHWRPKHYWPSGTKVTVSAKVYGKELGKGLYGQSDVSTSFTVGRKQVTVARDTAPKSVNKVKVYNAAGHVIRTMNTSMGEHGGTTVNGKYINFYTLNGTYTVLDHEQPAKMCSDSYGLPATAPGGYACEDIYNATKISIDGIYLHKLLTTVWAQDNGHDVSHGCLNLNASNSKWYFDHSMIGDPVVIHGAKHAPQLQEWQGGDWSVPWSKWLHGSAL